MALKTIFIGLLAALFMVTPALAVEGPAVDSIASQVMCQCGCGMTVANCNHQGCPSRDQMRSMIEQGLAKGQSSKQIIQSFIAMYGEKVLVEPPKKGFNLVAWITPFAAIVLGAGVIFLLVREWVNRGKTDESVLVTETAAADPKDEEYNHRLENELKNFKEKGFR